MVGVAQLVRAPDCGSGGRGFETHHSPSLVQAPNGAFFVGLTAKNPAEKENANFYIKN